MPCSLLTHKNALLHLRAFDYVKVILNGTLVRSIFRAQPPAFLLPELTCSNGPNSADSLDASESDSQRDLIQRESSGVSGKWLEGATGEITGQATEEPLISHSPDVSNSHDESQWLEGVPGSAGMGQGTEDQEELVELVMVVEAMGRDNFFATGTPQLVQKGILAPVRLERAAPTPPAAPYVTCCP